MSDVIEWIEALGVWQQREPNSSCLKSLVLQLAVTHSHAYVQSFVDCAMLAWRVRSKKHTHAYHCPNEVRSIERKQSLIASPSGLAVYTSRTRLRRNFEYMAKVYTENTSQLLTMKHVNLILNHTFTQSSSACIKKKNRQEKSILYSFMRKLMLCLSLIIDLT